MVSLYAGCNSLFVVLRTTFSCQVPQNVSSPKVSRKRFRADSVIQLTPHWAVNDCFVNMMMVMVMMTRRVSLPCRMWQLNRRRCACCRSELIRESRRPRHIQNQTSQSPSRTWSIPPCNTYRVPDICISQFSPARHQPTSQSEQFHATTYPMAHHPPIRKKLNGMFPIYRRAARDRYLTFSCVS